MYVVPSSGARKRESLWLLVKERIDKTAKLRTHFSVLECFNPFWVYIFKGFLDSVLVNQPTVLSGGVIRGRVHGCVCWRWCHVSCVKCHISCDTWHIKIYIFLNFFSIILLIFLVSVLLSAHFARFRGSGMLDLSSMEMVNYRLLKSRLLIHCWKLLFCFNNLIDCLNWTKFHFPMKGWGIALRNEGRYNGMGLLISLESTWEMYRKMCREKQFFCTPVFSGPHI